MIYPFLFTKKGYTITLVYLNGYLRMRIQRRLYLAYKVFIGEYDVLTKDIGQLHLDKTDCDN